MKHLCSNCSNAGTSKCGKCKLAFYCSRECQVAHFGEHQATLCKGVTRCMKLIAKEERQLRIETPGIFGDGAHGEWDGVGNFWGIFESRDYMRARHKYFLFLDQVGTAATIEEALRQGRDMLRLCRGDNLGIRSLMPAMLLVLRSYDRMQECYDFVKWWMTGDPDGRYDWGNPSLPYLNIHGADMCEPVLKEALGRFGDVYWCVSLTVIKMHLHHDVRTALRAIDALLGATVAITSPMQRLRGHEAVLSNIVSFLRPTYPSFMDRSLGQLRCLETSLSVQVETLMAAVEGRNPRTWKALVNPGNALRALIPPGLSMGSAEETICLVRSFTHVFNMDCADARMLRKRLVERVGEEPIYDLTSMYYR